MSRLFVTAALLPVLLLGCTSDSPTDADSPIAFETILQAQNSGLTVEGNQVVRNEADWARVWADLHRTTSPKPPLPAVDFSQDLVLVSAMGERPDGCYSIEVAEVILRGGRLHVRVVQRQSVGCGCTTALTYPVHVVRVRLVLPGISFDVEQRTVPC